MAPTMPKKKTKRLAKKKEEAEISEEDRKPGVVYIGHIPHGFYERQIKDYFSQFGKVLQLKVSRSNKSGKAKGYAFVKFQYAAVAKTVAETCHNYLFFNKLLKCEYKPLADIHPDTFFHYYMQPNKKPKRLYNRPQNDKKINSAYREMVGKQEKKMAKLRALGLDVDLKDVVEIDTNGLKSSEPQPVQQKVEATVESNSEATPMTQRKSVKRKAEPIDTDSGETPRRSVKRKAETADVNSPSPSMKVSPAAKRLKRAAKEEKPSPVKTNMTKTLKKSPSAQMTKVTPKQKKEKSTPVKTETESTPQKKEKPSPVKTKAKPTPQKEKQPSPVKTRAKPTPQKATVKTKITPKAKKTSKPDGKVKK